MPVAPIPAVADQASRVIRNWIAQGRYAAGTQLPSQRELCAQLGVSRTSLREALSNLQGMGLLRVRPGKGMYVAQPSTDNAGNPALKPALHPSLNPDGSNAPGEAAPPAWRFSATCALADVYQLRFVLEGFTARLAAQAVQADDVARLRANLTQMQAAIEAEDLARASQLDFEFHLSIAALSGNRAMLEVLRASGEMMRESQRLPFYQRAARGTTGQEHLAIIEALAQGQSEAAGQAMTQHIVQAAQRAGVHFPAE